MNIKRIGAGNRMSKGVVHAGTVYLSGLVAEAAAGQSVKEQTSDILAQIDAALKEAGTDKSALLKANIWLTDISTFAEMNEAWDAWVVPGQTPARATVESKLAAPGLDVEIMVEAAIDRAAQRAAGRDPAAAKKPGARKAAREARAAKKGGINSPEKKVGARRAAKKAARLAKKGKGPKE